VRQKDIILYPLLCLYNCKKIMKKSCFILMYITAFISPFYGSAGTSGGVLLKQFVGARAPAMGEAFVAVADDIYALHYNPAGLVKINKEFSAIYYKDQTVDFSYGLIGYGQSLKKIGTLAGSLFVYDAGKISYEDEQGNLATFNVQQDYLYTLGFARKLTKDLSLGTNFKTYISELKNGYYKANSFCFDMGGLYNTPVKGFSIGAVLQNVGTAIKYTKMEEKDPLPKTIRFGTAYRFQPLKGYKFTLSADIVKPNDNDLRKNFGMECSVRDLLYLRAGYKIGYDFVGNYSFGIGLRLSEVQIDYGAVIQKFLMINPVSISWKKSKKQVKAISSGGNMERVSIIK